MVGQFAGNSTTTGEKNTFIGAVSGRYVSTGSGNTLLGSYNGNQSGLDIRTSSNNIVLSDGDCNVPFVSGGTGKKVSLGEIHNLTQPAQVYIGLVNTTDSQIRSTNKAANYANGATLDFNNRSGLLVINNWTIGTVALFTCGGGGVVELTNTSSSYTGTVSFTSGVYRWTNSTGTAYTYNFFWIATRDAV
jgi:hypothetical protein